MTFLNLPTDDDETSNAVRLRHLGAMSTVLKYAPPRLRPETADPIRIHADLRYWRERAFSAETRLRVLETRVQTLAARSGAVRNSARD